MLEASFEALNIRDRAIRNPVISQQCQSAFRGVGGRTHIKIRYRGKSFK